MRPVAFYLSIGGILIVISLIVLYGGKDGPLQPSPEEKCFRKIAQHSITNQLKTEECTSEVGAVCQEKKVTCSIELKNNENRVETFEVGFNYLEEKNIIKTLTLSESFQPQESKTLFTETVIRNQNEIDCAIFLNNPQIETDC
jgi:hypothetical protein